MSFVRELQGTVRKFLEQLCAGGIVLLRTIPPEIPVPAFYSDLFQVARKTEYNSMKMGEIMATQAEISDKNSFFHRVSAALEIDTRMLAMIGALLSIWIILNILTEGIFFSSRNLYNLAVQSSVVGIMATGMVLVIVARHIDLSVGSLMGFTGMVIAYLQVHVFTLGASWNWPMTVFCGLLGAVVGLWQGWWIAYRGVPAFVVTLGGCLFSGVELIWSPMDALSHRWIRPISYSAVA